MLVKVLLAECSDVMRPLIVRMLKDEPRIELAGEAANFKQTMQMIKDFKPQVLLMDLHLPERQGFACSFVKSQLHSIQLLAMSVANDDEAKALADSYGARVLLDKMKLYPELIPTILKFAQQAPGTLRFDPQIVPPISSKSQAI